MMSQPLKRETMGAQIAALLRRAILTGELPPGQQLVESALAVQFGASRGPLREALRQLIEEGLLVNVPYTGTRVADISLQDMDDIYAMRICLEQFAFEQIWDKRDDAFAEQMHKLNAKLKDAIDREDHVGAIEADLDLHGVIYSYCDNRLLLNAWNGLRGHIQMYWSANYNAHDETDPKRASHDGFVALALGDSLSAMHTELREHMRRGFETTKAFVEARHKAETLQNRR